MVDVYFFPGFMNNTNSEQTIVSNRTKQRYDRLKQVINPNNLPMVLIKLAKTNIMT
jgi:hypothetical protein